MIGRVSHELDMLKNKIYITYYLREMYKSRDNDTAETICKNTKQRSKKYTFSNIYIYSITYFLILLGYGITVNIQEKSERKGMGWLNILLVFVTDSIILSKSF